MKQIRIALLAAAVLAGAGLAPAASAATSAAAPRTAASAAAADPSVISEWNAIAERTIFTEALTPVPSSGLYFGFVQTAVYNAVVTIKGGYEQYTPQPRPQRRASARAATAAAAYNVLNHYFPASGDALAADYSASLGEIRPGAVRQRGVRVGRAAATAIIGLREDDGRDADVTLTVEPQPGVWRPTPDTFTPMLVPWLGFVDPLLLRRPTQFAPPGPDSIRSAAYARDFAEVKYYGALEDSFRSPAQTETALFYSDNLVHQFQSAMRDQAARRGLGLVQTARMFALVDSSVADSLIGCWRAKYDRAYWRPITAIREAGSDRNPWTATDADWSPLVPTPPYPDYVSGHACIVGAASESLSHLFGARHLDLTLESAVTGTTRHIETAGSLDRQTMNARIWLGLHFRKAMTDGNRLGHDVAAYGVRHHFQPEN